MPSHTILTAVDVVDLRVPTSDTLLGSDPFHRKPNYSATITTIRTNSDISGVSVNFTIGAGTDWICYGVKDLAQLVVDTSLEEFIDDPGAFHKKFIDHHQLRWLADGCYRMAVGSIVNAMWDLWAKYENKPLWKLLVDLPPEKIVQSIDWRYLKDALTPDEALDMLRANKDSCPAREDLMKERGPKAYSTAGWLGLTDDQIIETINEVKAVGFDSFKMKVGGDLQHDRERLTFIRKVIGESANLMLDANQVWSVDQAIAHMIELAPYRPLWIEEPTARDEVLGFAKIAEALDPYKIGIATGEQVPSPVIFKQLLASGSIAFCQIDATRMGGVNDVLAVILMAAKFGIPICPHGGGIGLCNMVQHYALWDQIAVSARSDIQFVEYLNFLQEDAFVNSVRVENGSYIAPTSPGWGLEMHADFTDAHTYPTGSVWVGREASGSVTFIA